MRRLTNEEFIEKFKENNKDYCEYHIIDEYKNSRTKIMVEHLTCGKKYKVLPRDFMRGLNRCSDCYSKKVSLIKRRSTSEVISKVSSILGKDYKVLGCDFKQVGKKWAYYVTINHLKCGKTYTTREDHISVEKRLCSCTRQVKSVGEKLLAEYLENSGIEYEHPKLFPDLVDQLQLHYDFYLPKLNVLIEYQGMQHYYKNHQIVRKGDTKSNVWNTQIKHDNMKRDYANRNGMVLIEIPYVFNTYESIASYTRNNLNMKCKK